MKSHKKTIILIICGPSGVGKDSLINYLKKKYPDVFTIFVSATTRAPREGEEYGKDYFFLSQEQFKQWVKEEKFIEHEEVWPGIFYGSVKIGQNILNSGKISISDIDIAGAISIKKFYGDQACVIFLTPPEPAEEELTKRLHGRGKDSDETIKGRVAKARKEIALAKDGYEKKLIDYIFVSDKERAFYNDVSRIVDKLIQ
jgi:guanylate kinase